MSNDKTSKEIKAVVSDSGSIRKNSSHIELPDFPPPKAVKPEPTVDKTNK